MSWVRRAFSIALFVATFGAMGAAILGVMDPLFMLIAWAALLADSLLAINRHHKRLNRPAPAEPPRPDADVAQYLNDDDRKWLGEFAPDWTEPTPTLAPSHGSAARDLQRIDRELAALERKSADKRAQDAFDDDGDLSEIVIVDASSGKPVRRYTRDGQPVRRGLDSATRQILLAQAAVLATRVDDEVSWLKVADQPLKQKRRRPRL